MKSALQTTTTAICFSLCFVAFGRAARAQTDAPEIPVTQTAMTEEIPAKSAIVLLLEAAVEGLQMSSETDAPFQVVFIEFAQENGAIPQKMKAEELAKLAGAPENAAIETRELDAFFEVAATIEDWMNDEEKATAQRFAALLETLKTQLQDAQVVVWGEAKKSVAIIGKCDGGAAGVTTIIVET